MSCNERSHDFDFLVCLALSSKVKKFLAQLQLKTKETSLYQNNFCKINAKILDSFYYVDTFRKGLIINLWDIYNGAFLENNYQYVYVNCFRKKTILSILNVWQAMLPFKYVTFKYSSMFPNSPILCLTLSVISTFKGKKKVSSLTSQLQAKIAFCNKENEKLQHNINQLK